MLALFATACDDGQHSTTSPTLEAFPEAFTFSKLAVGESAQREVEISNLGRAPLKIHSFKLVDDSTAKEFELFVEADGGLQPPPQTATVEDNPLVLVVRYTPKDENEAADVGEVQLSTNDPDAHNFTLPITSASLGAELSVYPTALDFGQVSAGSRETRTVKLQNLGLAKLEISEFRLNGSTDFSLLESAPISLLPNESTTLSVTYAPLALGSDQGELTIFSNDNITPQVSIPLYANGSAACLRVPSLLDFGKAMITDAAPVDSPNKRLLSLESCGSSALEIKTATLTDANGVFTVLDLPQTSAGQPLYTLPGASDGVEPSQTLTVAFTPKQEISYGAKLTLTTNDPASPHEVDLFGQGSSNACPVPVVRQEHFEVQPLDLITLDASDSYDPGGQVRRYVWTVISRPQGSVAQPVESFDSLSRPADGGPDDDETTPTALFFVDLAGDYVISLQVYDDLGQVSCAPESAEITIHAVPQKDLHIQLVWSTPDDPDETDGYGTDLDLHLRHPNAGNAWGQNAGSSDCYFGNPNPDWGVLNDVSDNPTLDIDDKNGAGPENINLQSPEIGTTYDIAALYFRSESTFGETDRDPRQAHTSYATIRVFVKGDLLAEYVDKPLTQTRQLWHFARLTWCGDFTVCPTIDFVDNILSESDYAYLK